MPVYIKKSFTPRDIAFVLIVLIMATSSFDVFLNLRIGGYSLRFTFLLISVLIFLLITERWHSNKVLIVKVLGLMPLLSWTILLVVFIPNTTILGRNIGYMAWFLLLLGFMFTLPSYIVTINDLNRLLKWYMRSFLWVALFGFVQFALGIVGIPLLTTQYWTATLPRINGFSYEPSYFATYLMLAWGMAFYGYRQQPIVDKLRSLYNGSVAFVRPNQTLLFVIITSAIVLSSSRMGILVISVVLGGYAFGDVVRLLFLGRVKKRSLMMIALFIITVSVALYVFIVHFDEIAFLLAGIGIGGTSAHSSIARTSQFADTLAVFWESPFIGYSLGGIPSAVAQLNGTVITTQDEAKENEGMNVFAETLAASGIVGFMFFILFLIRLLRRCHWAAKVAKRQGYHLLSISLNGLITGFILELIILNFNQTILRPYLWIHIAIMNSAYFVFIREHRLASFVSEEKEAYEASMSELTSSTHSLGYAPGE